MSVKTEELLREAEKMLEQGELGEAAELFEKAHDEEAATDKKNPGGAIGLARIGILVGEIEDAKRILGEVLKNFGDNAEAVMYRGVVEEAETNIEGALEYYQKAVKLDPKNGRAHYNLGRTFGQLKRWKEAFSELQKAVLFDPDNLQVQYSFGIVCQESGDSGKAIEAFSNCIEINPLFLDGYVTLADILANTGNDKLALETLENALGIFVEDPASGILYEKIAALALRMGDPAGAGGVLQRLTEQEPDNIEAWLQLSVVALMVMDLETVEDASKAAIEIDPEDWRGHYHLGICYDAVKQKESAQECFENAVSLEPDDWRPYNNLANLYLESEQSEDWAKAVDGFEKALTLEPPVEERHVVLYNMALAYFKVGDMEKSQFAAHAAAENGPEGDSVTEDAKRFLGNFEVTE